MLGESVYCTSIALLSILVVPEFSVEAHSRLQSKGGTDACIILVCCLLLSFASELWLQRVCFSHVPDIRSATALLIEIEKFKSGRQKVYADSHFCKL